MKRTENLLIEFNFWSNLLKSHVVQISTEHPVNFTDLFSACMLYYIIYIMKQFHLNSKSIMTWNIVIVGSENKKETHRRSSGF